MDLKKAGELLRSRLTKETALRLVVILGLCGIALLALSSWDFGGEEGAAEAGRQEQAQDYGQYARQLEADLCRVVTAVTGEKDPVVMVTLENSGRSVYAADERQQAGGDGEEEREWTHVILEDRDGAQSPLTVTEQRPKVQGVVIVSRRAQDPAVREQLVNAAKTALGVSSARVCVAVAP